MIKNKLRSRLKLMLRSFGIECSRFNGKRVGLDALKDSVPHLPVGKESRLIIFDVGANTGQSVIKFKSKWPDSKVYSFEPSPGTFKKLVATVGELNDVNLFNLGLAEDSGELEFSENEYSDMSSFLAPDKAAWGEVVNKLRVGVRDLSSFVEEKEIPRIDILKTDTQGFDLNVLRGAKRLLEAKKIEIIYTEVNFVSMYQGVPKYYEIFQYLDSLGYSLIGFYDQHYADGKLAWCDALFCANR